MEMTKEKRIDEELKRISVWFSDMDENERAVIDPIMQNSAFMKVTLDDLQEIINREGVIDHYQNGANQYGLKPSATLQSYNSLVKNYAAVNKTLFSLLPPQKRKQVAAPVIPGEREKIREMERKLEEEKRKRINAEIAAAAEMQRREREARPVQ